MSKIKVQTTLKHRFGKPIRISKEVVNIDSKGIAEISEESVPFALNAGFELVDKNQTFKTKEQQDQIKAISETIESAKKQAEEIIKEANRQAEEIIKEAKRQAGQILVEGKVDEKADYVKALQSKKVEEIREIMLGTDLFKEEDFKKEDGKNLTKDELIQKMLEVAFSETEE